MKLRTGLLLFALGSFPLVGCNEPDSSTGPSNGPTQVGTLDFALPAALRAQVAGTADSLRVEMRHGNAVRSISVALDSTAHAPDLDPGMWTISVGLYQLDGTLKYYGEDSVLVQSGKRALAVVTLRPAKGSVDIVIRLELPQDPQPLFGTWYVIGVDSASIYDRSIPLTFGDTGHLSGSDGCNSFSGADPASSTRLRITRSVSTMLVRKMGHPWQPSQGRPQRKHGHGALGENRPHRFGELSPVPEGPTRPATFVPAIPPPDDLRKRADNACGVFGTDRRFRV